jgi:hypothetical protein
VGNSFDYLVGAGEQRVGTPYLAWMLAARIMSKAAMLVTAPDLSAPGAMGRGITKALPKPNA